MKLFISWSGELSKRFADRLADWLKDLFPDLDPFVSSAITKGARWADTIARELEQADFGIICVTRATMTAPWLNFEAGALSRRLNERQTPVATLLLDITDAGQVPRPLGEFNATVANREDAFDLVRSINTALSDRGHSRAELQSRFNRIWPQLHGAFMAFDAEDQKEADDLLASDERLVIRGLREMMERIRQAGIETRDHLLRPRGIDPSAIEIGITDDCTVVVIEREPVDSEIATRIWLAMRRAFAYDYLKRPGISVTILRHHGRFYDD